MNSVNWVPFPLVHCRFNSYFQMSISDSSNCWLQRIRRDQHLSIDCNQFCSKAFKRNQFLCILYPLNWTHPTFHHFCWIIHCTITFNQYKFIQKHLKMNHNYFPFLIFFHFIFFRLIFSSLNEFDSYSNLSLDFLTKLTPFMNLYFYSVDMKFESTQKTLSVVRPLVWTRKIINLWHLQFTVEKRISDFIYTQFS